MPTETTTDLHFPLSGLDVSGPFGRQPTRPMGHGRYSRTCRRGVNVRGYDPIQNRARGGSRGGLSRYVAEPVVADWIIQELAAFAAKGGGVQLSNAGRVVTLVAVSQGNVYYAVAGDTAWMAATNSTGDTPPLNYTGLMQSAANIQKLWFADGTNWVYFDPTDFTVKRWAPSAGLLPVDSADNTPRLICTWRGRMVLSGLLLDPQNWFMSAVNDPTDFDYAASGNPPTMAIAGNNGPQGLVGDVVTGLIPYTDDVLVIGGDSSIRMMRGDPMANGQIDLVSDVVGMAWGQAWCKDPLGTIYFVSNRMGIYSLVPGQAPQRISEPIEALIQAVDTGSNTIRLLWNDVMQGLHVFISPTDEPAATTHYFYELRTGAWWQDEFADPLHDPLACCVFDGNTATDRVSLIGSWDGYVRSLDVTATKDDRSAIASEVVLGPILSENLDDVLLKEIQGVLGADSNPVTYAVYVGRTAEEALAGDPVATGTWRAGRNHTALIRRSGHAVFLKVTSSKEWAFETARCVIVGKGKVRRRSKA